MARKTVEILRDGMKHERWGDYTLVRPDPQIIWPRRGGAEDYRSFVGVSLARAGTGGRAGDREDPGGAPGAVDLDAELDVLAGGVAAPGGGGLEGQGRHRRVARDVDLAADVDDPGPHLVGGPHRVDQLQVAVDPVRRRERRDDGGPQQSLG